jgi:hypothetical protein
VRANSDTATTVTARHVTRTAVRIGSTNLHRVSGPARRVRRWAPRQARAAALDHLTYRRVTSAGRG